MSKHWTLSPRRLLALIVAVFVCRALFALAVVPLWQHPDEPQHLEFIRILARQDRLDLSERSDVELQRNILASMREHGWWRHYSERAPSPLPDSFAEIPERIWGVGTSPPAYYLLGAAALKATRAESLVGQHQVLRWMALLLAVPTLLCVWAGARVLFGVQVATGATLLLALHPQFVLMSTAVNPDVLVNLCGAVLWWQGARLLTGAPAPTRAATSMALMTVATVVGILTKRVAAPLLLMLVIVPMVAVSFGRPTAWRTTWRAVGAAVVGLGLVGLAGLFWFGEEAARLGEYWSYLVRFSWSDEASDLGFFERFTTVLFDSFWLMAGWLTHPAPSAWLATVRVLSVAALVGCLIGVRRQGMAMWRAGLVLAGVLVAIQTAGVYVGLYANGLGPQGRYLFPVIGPFMALFWIGLHGWWPRRLWPAVSATLVALMLALDAIAWAGVLVPAYVG